jgi:AcrR family transcriptional regulator
MMRKLTSVGRPNYTEAALQQWPALRIGEGNPDNPQTGAGGLDMAREAAKKVETSTTLLEAAKKVLRQNGYAALSTRDVAAAAGVPLSQIHYHFGSKQGMVLALFEYLNAQLLDRQNAMFADTSLKLSEQWDRACDYLDDDITSGYVRILQELIAASWSDAAVAQVVRTALMGWLDLIVGVARKAEREFGSMGPFTPEEIGAFAANAFIGAESLYLLGMEKKGSPVRQALRRVGDLVRGAEATQRKAKR